MITPVTFTGFPEDALRFYEGLVADNSKAYWTDHKSTYDTCVKVPMHELLAQLEPAFGPAKFFRPYRDVRFAKDKTPYKTGQGAIVNVGAATGYYVEIAAPGVRVGGGYYHAGGPDLSRIRAAIDTPHSGEELERLVAGLREKGFEIRGEQLRTSPRGYDAGHPRIDLLRYKSMSLGKSYGFDDTIHGPGLLDRVREDWRALRPLVEWVRERVGDLG
jgi:uncharacterized protein (TIGR02453 family)